MHPEQAAFFYRQLIELIALRPADFILQYQKQFGDLTKNLAQQLNGLQKVHKKLPQWFANEAILYPPNLNLEQCSSELTAKYKASLCSGKSSIDLTGGFGVDSYFLNQAFKEHTYVEQQSDLFEIVCQNFKSLGAEALHAHKGSGIEWLTSSGQQYDLIFADPSRRVSGGKKFVIDHCEPNLIEVQDLLLEKGNQVMYKLSPLLDITSLVRQLKGVQAIHIVSVKNECKELLVMASKEHTKSPHIYTVNFLDESRAEHFNFSLEHAKVKTTRYSKALNYLYEPNASLLKSGAFDYVGDAFNLYKLHANTQLYTSSELLMDWPGRVFEIVDRPFTRVNVISRNHPLSPKQLIKKFRLTDGANAEFLLAFTDIEKPKTVFARKLS